MICIESLEHISQVSGENQPKLQKYPNNSISYSGF